MPGIFIYIKLLLLLSFKNLKVFLILQSIIDSLTCIIIFKAGSIIFPKEKKFILLFAVLSPLMIIISSQVLSETIFLFFFSLFLYHSIKVITYEKGLYLNILLAGLFLGLTTSIRAITYPLIFLSILPFTIIFLKNNIPNYKIIFASVIFLLFSLFPISLRIIDNLKSYNTYSLTSQSGTHLAFWVVPMILSDTRDISRNDAMDLVVKHIQSKYKFSNNPYKDDAMLRKASFEVLSQMNKFNIAYHWGKAGFINLFSPVILLDKSLRSLPHPSYYDTGNFFQWIKLISSKKEYYNYIIILFVASITSILSLILFTFGAFLVFKKNKIIFYITTLNILYFLVITGPVLSPKYIFPILPCIFLYQGVALYEIIKVFKILLKKKKLV
jgi:hypothetical protein